MNGTLAELLRATSRTFALGIELLPPPLDEEVRIAYLVLRVSDYLEDNRVMEPGRKVELLRLWHGILHETQDPARLAAELEGEEDPIPDVEAARHALDVVDGLRAVDARARSIIVKHAGDSTLGMARWVERGPRFEVEDDLDDYMHEVAGRVGYLLTDLFTERSRRIRVNHREMMSLGREFGLALQTVNVIRGLSSDRHRGWIFVPRSFIDEAGVPAEALFEPHRQELALRVLDRFVRKAERHFDAARAYVHGIPRRYHRIRTFCLLPLFFGVRTLAVSRSNPRVFEEEVKITRDEVETISRDTARFGISNTWVDWYAGRLLRT